MKEADIVIEDKNVNIESTVDRMEWCRRGKANSNTGRPNNNENNIAYI